MNTTQLSAALQELQKNTIGLFKPYASKRLELVVEENEHTIKSISIGDLGGYSTTMTPIGQGLYKRFPEGMSLLSMKQDPFALNEFCKQFKTK